MFTSYSIASLPPTVAYTMARYTLIFPSKNEVYLLSPKKISSIAEGDIFFGIIAFPLLR